MNSTVNRVYAATEWISKLAYLNLLWIGFSLLGLGVLGFFPSTISMFTVIRKWMRGETDLAIFRTFWNTYKSEFIKSNGLGLFIVIVGGLIILDLIFMKNVGGSMTLAIQIPLYLFIFVAVMTMLYLFPVYVQYDLKLFLMIKNSFLLMLINPVQNIIMIISIFAVFLVVKFIPGLGFFFGGSLSAAILMGTSILIFNKIDKKKQSG